MAVLLVVNTPACGSEGPSLEQMLTGLLERGVGVSCCGTCRATSGLSRGQLIQEARMATIHDLAEATVRSDLVASF